MIWKVPFVNYPLQYRNIKEDVDARLKDLLSRGELYLREETQLFEERFAKYVGCKHGISVNSCTDAMFLSMKALNIGKGDEVITVSHTYVSTIGAIVATGAKPVLIDVNKDTHNMDENLLFGAITKKTKAILPVHLNGFMCNMWAIMKVAKEHGLFIVEDAAQATGAMQNGNKAGSFGLGSFSFYPAKILGSFGDAGMITTNNEELADRLYALRDNGEKPKYRMTPQELHTRPIQEFGYMSVLDNIQAGILNIKLSMLPTWIARRRDLARLYDERLSHMNKITHLPFNANAVYQNYVVQTEHRNSLERYLNSKGIETMVSWRVPNHKQPNLKCLHKFNLPVTEHISDTVLSLPMYPELCDEEVGYVCDCIGVWNC